MVLGKLFHTSEVTSYICVINFSLEPIKAYLYEFICLAVDMAPPYRA